MLLILKLILIATVLVLSTFIGYSLANKYSARVSELCDLLLGLDILETKIKYTYDSLITSFSFIADNLKTKAYRIFYITAEELKENRNLSAGDCFKNVIDEEKIFLSLNKDDIEILKELGISLGQTDLDSQLQNIKLVHDTLASQLDLAKAEKEKNFKLYRNMGVLSGLIIIIILL